jgi:hypothetical protein
MMSRLVDSEGKLLSNSTPPQHTDSSLVAVCLPATASLSLHICQYYWRLHPAHSFL